MTGDFGKWAQSLDLIDPEDGDIDNGTFPLGAWDVLHEIFDTRGPISHTEVLRAWNNREEELARGAVDLVLTDLRRTTLLRPVIEIWRLEFGPLAIAYNGNDDV